MTKQILLKTPRGNTAVIPVDHYITGAPFSPSPLSLSRVKVRRDGQLQKHPSRDDSRSSRESSTYDRSIVETSLLETKANLVKNDSADDDYHYCCGPDVGCEGISDGEYTIIDATDFGFSTLR